MANKKKHLLIILGLCALTALFAASCVNLPVKVVPGQTENAGTPAPVSDLPADNPQDTGSEDNFIRNPQRESWTEPQSDVTVTPVVLYIEKKGESALIVRDDIPAVEYDAGGTVYSTPAPEYSAGGLKDEMEVYGYAPVNGAVVLPNQFMHLDVTLRNTGTTTWQRSPWG